MGVYFITGATGFLGQEILKELARDPENRFYCLIRRKKHRSSRYRLKMALRAMGCSINDRFKAVDGDLSRQNLGLEESDVKALCREITHVIHCGADVTFNQPLETIRSVNVAGTASICELARTCWKSNPCFEHLVYIGTAYVAGRRKGLVRETDLTDRYGFRNTYEQTKFEAEVLVRSHGDKGLPVIIFRPSIVLGAAATGRARPANVGYPLLRLFQRWDYPVVSFHQSTTIDLVPVDFLAKAVVYISADRTHAGRCFHLAAGPEKNVSLRTVFDIACEECGRRFLVVPFWIYRLISGLFLKQRRSKLLENPLLKSVIDSYLPFVWELNPVFSIEETEKALAGSGIDLPDVKTFLKNYIRFALRTRYGRSVPETGAPSPLSD